MLSIFKAWTLAFSPSRSLRRSKARGRQAGVFLLAFLKKLGAQQSNFHILLGVRGAHNNMSRRRKACDTPRRNKRTDESMNKKRICAWSEAEASDQAVAEGQRELALFA